MPQEWADCVVESVQQLDSVIEPANVHVNPSKSQVPLQQVCNGLLSINDETLSAAARDFRKILIGRKLNLESFPNWFDGKRWSDAHFDRLSEGLEGSQIQFLENLKRMPGSLAILKGPTGTGKTSVMQRVVLSALVMRKQVAVGTPLNKATNRFAMACEEMGATVCRWTSMERAVNKLKQIGAGKAVEYQRKSRKSRIYKVVNDTDTESIRGGNQLVRDRICQARDRVELVGQLARSYLDELDVEFGSQPLGQTLIRPLGQIGVQTRHQREKEERQIRDEEEEVSKRRSVRSRLLAIFNQFSDSGIDLVKDSERVSNDICCAFNIRIAFVYSPSTSGEILETERLDSSQAEDYALLADMRARAHESRQDSRIDEDLFEQQPERLTLTNIGLSNHGDVPDDPPLGASAAEMDFLCHWRKLTTQGFADASKDEQRRFEKAAEKVIIAAVLEVDVIVGIFGSFVDCPWLQPVIDLSIADEAGRALEAEVVAFFATFVHKPKILTGDDLLLGPTVITRARADADESENVNDESKELKAGSVVLNPLAAQLHISLLRRVSIYFPYTSLHVQYRAVPQISALYQEAVYRGLFTNHPSTAVATRPEAQEFQHLLRKHWGLVNKSVMLLDVNVATAEYEQCTLSKINHGFMVEGLKVLDILENEGYSRILGLTPYQGQKKLYDKALGKDATNVWSTIDNSHGVEADIVVLDLTVSASRKELTTFVRFCARLTLALSRARIGLIIIGSSSVGMLNKLPKDTTKLNYRLFYDFLFAYAKEHGFLVKVQAIRTSDASVR